MFPVKLYKFQIYINIYKLQYIKCSFHNFSFVPVFNDNILPISCYENVQLDTRLVAENYRLWASLSPLPVSALPACFEWFYIFKWLEQKGKRRIILCDFKILRNSNLSVHI